MKWLFTALVKALWEVWQDFQYELDREAAIIENARREAVDRDRAGQDATRGRMNVPEMASDDPGALRDWLRDRDSETK